MNGLPAIGTRVLLRCCPHGEPGTVTAIMRGKLVVEWRDLDFAGKHPLENLIVVPEGASSSDGTRNIQRS